LGVRLLQIKEVDYNQITVETKDELDTVCVDEFEFMLCIKCILF